MSFCAKNIVSLLAIMCLAYDIRPVRSQLNNYTRLCQSLSKKATRQHLKLCGKSGNNLEVTHERGYLNTMQQDVDSSSQTSIPERSPSKRLKRSLTSYPCLRPNISKNGYPINRTGLNLTIECAKNGNLWPASISWDVPKSKFGQADCTGYVVEWYLASSGRSCHYIRDKNTTSYLINSREDWTRHAYYRDTLYILVYPLPQSSDKFPIVHRQFQPPGCSDPANAGSTSPPLIGTSVTTLRSQPKTTIPFATNATARNTDTPILNGTKSGTQTGDTESTSKGPVVNKMVFSIVIVSLGVVILAIVFLVWKKGKGGLPDGPTEGAPHYISYIARNKSEALNVARWLHKNNVNVIMDKFSLIIPNRRVWSEKQLLEAEKIILVITPKYLEICNFDQSISNKENASSYNDELVYNEISLIRNKLIDKGEVSNKFIGILVGTKKKDLPHWMSQFSCYKYKNGKVDEEILDMLNSTV